MKDYERTTQYIYLSEVEQEAKELCKQETLEEAKQRILDSNFMNKNDADIFEMGVKWQQERNKNK